MDPRDESEIVCVAIAARRNRSGPRFSFHDSVVEKRTTKIFSQGVAHAPVLTSIARAAPAAAQSAADVWTIGHLHVRGARWVANALFGSWQLSLRLEGRAVSQREGAD